MRFEFLIVCRADLADAEFLRTLLGERLVANLNEVGDEELADYVRVTLSRPAPGGDTGGGERAVCGFDVEAPPETSYLRRVIDEFADALANTEGVEHVLKFYDELLVERNAAFLREVFSLEMKLRKALSIIYLAAYDDGYYDLLRHESTNIPAARRPDEAELSRLRENEFFHFDFSQYKNLNQCRQPKLDDLLNLLRDADDFVAFRNRLSPVPIADEGDSDLLASLKQLTDTVEKMRNCIAHNRTPPERLTQNYPNARAELERKLDDFLASFAHE